MEILEAEPDSFILVDGEPYIILIDEKPFPTLKAALANEIHGKKVTVDMGAIRFVSNGADIMSPGIVAADENINPGDIVLIIDETHGKPLAIGISLITGEEMVEMILVKLLKQNIMLETTFGTLNYNYGDLNGRIKIQSRKN